MVSALAHRLVRRDRCRLLDRMGARVARACRVPAESRACGAHDPCRTQLPSSRVYVSGPESTTAVHFASQRMDWPTPLALFTALHAEFAFTVDACASDENATVPRYWTERDEGLMQPWHGERVWMNPPYGRQLARWMEKADNEQDAADLIVALVPSRTDTRWWHEYAMQADEIRFLRGRLRFGDAVNNAPFPSCLVIWR